MARDFDLISVVAWACRYQRRVAERNADMCKIDRDPRHLVNADLPSVWPRVFF
jgi:hypothetical protein